MPLVRVIKDWDYPDLFQQTPGHDGLWDGMTFTLDPVAACDYVIVINRVPAATDIVCPPEHIWQITQEPPVPEYRWLRQGFDQFARVYTQDSALHGAKYILSHPALPWHLKRTYAALKQAPYPDKPRRLSWVTSAKRGRSGHRRRLRFLDRLRRQVEFDLWGRGFTPLDDKWDGIAPYRYALAVENHRAPYYWTEKLADCFLGWTLPIYYGCPNITDYFPAESMVQIDITKPDEAIEIIRETIQSDLWQRRRDAIAYARDLILDSYQFFPFVVAQIRAWERDHPALPPQPVHLRELPYRYPVPRRTRWSQRIRQARARLGRLKYRLLP